MRTILRSDFFWQFLGGFALGAIGLTGLHFADVDAPTQAAASATTRAS